MYRESLVRKGQQSRRTSTCWSHLPYPVQTRGLFSSHHRSRMLYIRLIHCLTGRRPVRRQPRHAAACCSAQCPAERVARLLSSPARRLTRRCGQRADRGRGARSAQRRRTSLCGRNHRVFRLCLSLRRLRHLLVAVVHVHGIGVLSGEKRCFFRFFFCFFASWCFSSFRRSVRCR